jgi:YVTN family beta-propeller protein
VLRSANPGFRLRAKRYGETSPEPWRRRAGARTALRAGPPALRWYVGQGFSPADRARRVLRATGLVAALALSAGACSGSGRPAEPDATAKPAVGNTLYVSNETQGTVVVLDAATGAVRGNVPVGKRPRGLKLSRDGSRLFVALSGSPIAGPGVDESKLPPADRSADGIGVVDITTRRLERIYPSGPDPEAFDLSPDGRTLYVSNEDTAELSALDLGRGTIIGRVHVCGEPEGVTVSPDGRMIYVTCEADNAVAVVDARSLKVINRVRTAARPRAIAVTPDGRTLFVTCETAATVSVIDAAAQSVTGAIQLTMPDITETAPRPMGAVLSPDAHVLFVTTGRARSVAVIDATTRTPSRMIMQVGARPWGIAISPDGRHLYTANGPSGDVSFIDVASGAVTRRTSVGGSPWGVVRGP